MVDFSQVNYWAVAAATIVTMFLGFLWYSQVLFSKAWVKQMDKKMEDMSGGGPMTYVLTALTALGGSWVLALILTLSDNPSIGTGMTVGLLMGIAVALKIGMNFLFEGRKPGLYYITVGYHLVSFVLSGLIIGAMQG
ncbi:DUF1761 domain-containing protein [Cohnella pontilimi]|uniref:DUF1761 domain-containing protein n=1 Tax=Cohnella pontilimi TaxID=2564100 RepID=UPI00145CDA20|nr:DUF1761 domain-containing protein [Cohnella pontilimi]